MFNWPKWLQKNHPKHIKRLDKIHRRALDNLIVEEKVPINYVIALQQDYIIELLNARESAVLAGDFLIAETLNEILFVGNSWIYI